jgi:hypothetical protein
MVLNGRSRIRYRGGDERQSARTVRDRPSFKGWPSEIANSIAERFCQLPQTSLDISCLRRKHLAQLPDHFACRSLFLQPHCSIVLRNDVSPLIVHVGIDQDHVNRPGFTQKRHLRPKAPNIWNPARACSSVSRGRNRGTARSECGHRVFGPFSECSTCHDENKLPAVTG